jgi:Flp pilus assembly protein TadG
MWPRPEKLRGQRGAVVIWFALFLIVILMFIALGIDMAKLMATRTQLENAADAAALAGATAFQAADRATIPHLAKMRAFATAYNNTAYESIPTAVQLDTTGDVIVNMDSSTVKVTTRRETSQGTGVVTQFLQVIGMNRLNMRATATAKASGGCNLLPVAGRPDPGPDFIVGCTEYILKYGGGQGTNGSYGALDLSNIPCPGNTCPGNPGGDTYRCELANGFPCCLGDSLFCIDSKTGNMAGPTAQGIHDRFLADTDRRSGICYTDYTGNGQRIVTVPITLPPQGGNGTNACFPLLRYGYFFLTRDSGDKKDPFVDKDKIYANFMGYRAAGGTMNGNFRVWLIK